LALCNTSHYCYLYLTGIGNFPNDPDCFFNIDTPETGQWPSYPVFQRFTELVWSGGYFLQRFNNFDLPSFVEIEEIIYRIRKKGS